MIPYFFYINNCLNSEKKTKFHSQLKSNLKTIFFLEKLKSLGFLGSGKLIETEIENRYGSELS